MLQQQPWPPCTSVVVQRHTPHNIWILLQPFARLLLQLNGKRSQRQTSAKQKQ